MTSETAAAPPAARPSGVRLLPSEGVEGKPVSLWRTARRRLFQRRSAMVGMAILGLLIGCAIFAPWIAPYEPAAGAAGRRRRRPARSALHPPARLPGRSTAALDGDRQQRARRVQPGVVRCALLARDRVYRRDIRHHHRHGAGGAGRPAWRGRRQRHHARNGRAAGVPSPVAGHRHRRRARPGPAQRVDRHRHCLDPDLRPGHARQRPEHPRDRTTSRPRVPWGPTPSRSCSGLSCRTP